MPCEAVSARCRSPRPSSGSASSHPTSGLPSRPSMRVVDHPLMVLDDHARTQQVPDGVEVGIVDADDDLAALSAVAEVAFAAPGTATGTGPCRCGRRGRRAEPGHDRVPAGRMLARLTVAAAARVTGVVVAVGWHQPLDGASEIVGVATLPTFRRRGLGAAVTGALVADALEQGVGTVFLSADDDDVARVYTRVGFRRVGTACAASVATR